MKKLLLSIIMLGFVAVANSQTLRLIVDNEDLTNSSYTYSLPVTTTEDIKLHIQIANTNDQDVNVLVRKNVLSETTGHQNSFCIGNCYPPTTFESTEIYTIPANDTTGYNVFYIEFRHGDAVGQSQIEYTVFERGNNDNSVTITVTFDITGETAISANTYKTAISAYPNPINSGDISFKVDGLNGFDNSKIIIRNILGSTLKVVELNSNIVRTSIDDLPNGIYLYTLEQNGINVATKRFLVRK